MKLVTANLANICIYLINLITFEPVVQSRQTVATWSLSGYIDETF
jgi:hypothetical protein